MLIFKNKKIFCNAMIFNQYAVVAFYCFWVRVNLKN